MIDGARDSTINRLDDSMIGGTDCESGRIDFNWRDHPNFVTREPVLGLMRNVGYIGQGLITSDTNLRLVFPLHSRK